MSKPYTYDTIPPEMRGQPTWVLWRRAWNESKSKYDKIPLQVNGYPASITNPQHMSGFNEALFAYNLGVADGIGFCLTPGSGLVFLDLDGAINCTGYTANHQPLLDAFQTWGELSQSGKGVHLICKGDLDRARVLHPAGFEMYSTGRYIAMTGWALNDRPLAITDQQDNIDKAARHIDALRGTSGQALLPPAPRPELVADPPALDTLTIGREVYQFMAEGIADRWDGDRSRALYAAALALYRTGLDDSQVLTLLWDHCGHIATEHRTSGGHPLDWLWQYTIHKAKSVLPPEPDVAFEPVTEAVEAAGIADPFGDLLTRIAALERTSPMAPGEARRIVGQALKLDMAQLFVIRDQVRQKMGWTKKEFERVLAEVRNETRGEWRQALSRAEEVYQQHIFVGSMNLFMNMRSRVMYAPAGFLGEFGHLDPDIREKALAADGCAKVAALDFAPGKPEFFRDRDTLYYNMWQGLADTGAPGEVGPWLRHLALLVPGEVEREHLLDWMACTLQRPGEKVNHCVIMCGGFGQGKDTLWLPIVMALGSHVKQEEAGAMMRDFNEHLLNCKLFIIQEADIGNHRDASRIANKLKPILASPPDTLSIYPKGSRAFDIQNVVHTVMFSNETRPAYVRPGDRRYFVIRSDVQVMNADGTQKAKFAAYFDQLNEWLRDRKGYRHVIDHLLRRDLSRFNPKHPPPSTVAKLDLIEANRSPMEALLLEGFALGLFPLTDTHLAASDLFNWFATHGVSMLSLHGLTDVPSVRIIGAALQELGAVQVRQRRNGLVTRLWDVSSILESLRLIEAPEKRAPEGAQAGEWLN